MLWTLTDPMLERAAFVAAYRDGLYTIAELAERYLAPHAYPSHFEVRWISSAGTVKFKRRQFFVSTALKHEHIAFEEMDDGLWSVYFYDVLLARLDERDYVLRP